MIAKRISFPEANRAVLEEFELDEKLEGAQALVQAEYTIISAGTEGASPLPRVVYSRLGRSRVIGFVEHFSSDIDAGRCKSLSRRAQ